MLTQYSQRYQNNQSGYGRGQGGYQGRGGYNNQRGYRQGGGNPGAAGGGAGRYQNQQQNNNQYQPRNNRNYNNQGGNGQYQQNNQMGGRPVQSQGQPMQYGQQRPSRGGGPKQNQQYRSNQSQQYPNQRRQYQQQNRQNNHSNGRQQYQQQYPSGDQQPAQQRIAIDQSGFPSLGGGAPAQQSTQPAAMPQMPVPQMPVPAAAQQPNAAAVTITPEDVAKIGAPDAQKQFLGEHLYGRVTQYDEPRAGRIVGMILDAYSTDQICDNLANEQILKQTVERATETLMEHEKKQGGQSAV